jgi:hypothetical protein
MPMAYLFSIFGESGKISALLFYHPLDDFAEIIFLTGD